MFRSLTSRISFFVLIALIMGGFPNYIIQEAYAMLPTFDSATSSTGVIAGNSTLTSQIEVKFAVDVNATSGVTAGA